MGERWNAGVVVVCPYCDRALEVIVHGPDGYTRTQSKTCVWCGETMVVEYSATVSAIAVKEEDDG